MISPATGNEAQPAIDEQPPAIGPNLAANEKLCRDVTQYLSQEYWWPYELMQQRFWDANRRIDYAWRVRSAVIDTNPTAVTLPTQQTTTPLPQDGQSAKGQSVMPFKQIKAVTDLGEILSFEDGLPMRAEVPEDVDENQFYQPTEQSAKALNSLIRQNCEKVGFRDKHRQVFGCFAKYGYSAAHCPFELRYKDFAHPPVPVRDQFEAQHLAMEHQGMQPELVRMPQGVGISFHEMRQEIVTAFNPLHYDDLMIDPFVKLLPTIESQPCPMVREYVTNADLDANRYDAKTNPFGYLNVELAVDKDRGHFMLNDVDMQPLRDRLRLRYNLNDQVGGGLKRDRAHKRWTMYPMLAIDDQGNLDTGDGVPCPQCMGQRKLVPPAPPAPPDGSSVSPEVIDCPTCKGTGKVHPPTKRYVVNLYGDLTLQTTCLRIQEMPVNAQGETMPIPILFGADLVEDDAATIPMSKSEVMLVACEQVTRAESQFENSKEQTINRGWKVQMDSPAWKVQNFNAPNARIPWETDPREAERCEQSSYDDSVTLIPYIDRCDRKIQDIYGATDTLLGQLAQGRRSALEVGEATDAAKNPMVIMVDRFNHQIPGRFAKLIQWNVENFGDRDYVMRMTGRTYFGACRIFTAVAKEFLKKMALAQNLLTVLQSSTMDPTLAPVRADIWNAYFKLSGIDIRVPDSGQRIAQAKALNIINKILAYGIPDPALPSDPHEVFIGAFEAALQDPYWQQQFPTYIPLLYQRLMQQQQLFAMQQAQAFQMQLAQQQALNPPKQEAPGAKGKQAPNGHGQAMQNQQGPQGATA
jgi:hypothetical protein